MRVWTFLALNSRFMHFQCYRSVSARKFHSAPGCSGHSEAHSFLFKDNNSVGLRMNNDFSLKIQLPWRTENLISTSRRLSVCGEKSGQLICAVRVLKKGWRATHAHTWTGVALCGLAGRATYLHRAVNFNAGDTRFEKMSVRRSSEYQVLVCGREVAVTRYYCFMCAGNL